MEFLTHPCFHHAFIFETVQKPLITVGHATNVFLFWKKSIYFGSPVKVICGIMFIFYTISSLSSSSDCNCCFLLSSASIFLIRSLLGFLLFFFCRGLRDASWFHNCFAVSFSVFTCLPVHAEHSHFTKLYHNQHNLILLCSFFIYLTSVMSHRLSGLQSKINAEIYSAAWECFCLTPIQSCTAISVKRQDGSAFWRFTSILTGVKFYAFSD